jgi:hypothetical protein
LNFIDWIINRHASCLSAGTFEAPLNQFNDDPVSDFLYTSNFALLGLHEVRRKTPPFEQPFMHKNDDFTKTGSGQT